MGRDAWTAGASPPGTYVVVVRARDAAGNIGTSVPEPPRPDYGRPLPAAAGSRSATSRAQAPSAPVTAGETARVAVDAAGARFTWRLRRVGDSAIAQRGSGTRTRVVRFRAPGGKSGLYLFEVTHAHAPHRDAGRRAVGRGAARARRAAGDDVAGPQPGRRRRRRAPDTLAAGLPVRLARPFVKDGLPPQIRRHEALLLA